MARIELDRPNPGTSVSGQLGDSKLIVGRYTYGLESTEVNGMMKGVDLIIGQFCSIAPNVTFHLAFDHRTDWVTTYPFGFIHKDQLGSDEPDGYPTSKGSIVIGNDVWIGKGATILSGVRIGHGAVVAGGAMVTKDVADYTIVAGNPAQMVKNRFSDEIKSILLELKWWDLPLSEILRMRTTLCATPDSGSLLRLVERYRRR